MLIEALKPLTVRLPDGDITLDPGQPMDFPDDHVSKLIALVPHKVRLVALPAGDIVDAATDAHQSSVAVHIGGSAIGDYWLCLSDTEPFDPGDGLPVYRPSEIKALRAKSCDQEALLAAHRVKTIVDGKIVR